MINFHRGSSRMDLLRNFLVFSLCIVAANAEGKFYVLSSTSESLSFEGSSPLKSEEVGVVALASTGLHISDEGTWDGMYIKDPFDLPSVAVVVEIEDASEISFKSVQHTYSAEGNAASSALLHVSKAAKDITCDIHFTNHNDGVLAIDRCFSALIIPDEPHEPEHPEETKPDENKPDENKPDENKPDEDKPEGEGDKPGEEGESGTPGETRTSTRSSTKANALKPDNEDDKMVLNAIAGINKMAEKAAALRPSAEFVFVRLSLAALKKAHQGEQGAVNEAVELLGTAVDNLQTKIIAAKGKKVVMFGIVTEIATKGESTTEAPDTKPTDEDGDETTAVTEPTDDLTTIAEGDTTVGEEDAPPAEDTRSGKKYNSQKTAERKKRSAGAGSGGEGEGGKPTYEHNLAVYYNEDYPVIFNIILWFMVTFGLSLLAICYAIGDMDPGRDSIIYRMTSTRMKKDN